MSQAPTKSRENQEEKKDNIFLEIISSILIQLPVAIITWVFSLFNSN